MSEKDGGPALCGRRTCAEVAVRKQGHQWLCAKHYRFGQMRVRAKRDGKVTPTHEQLENLFSWDGLKCRDCGRHMNWLRHEGAASQITLQHYRSGSMGFVCLSCNARHASMPGDSYQQMPKDHKRCPSCKTVKSAAEFTIDQSRSGELRRKSKCRACSDAATTEWKENNRDRYNEYQRAYRARRKMQGNPVNGGG